MLIENIGLLINVECPSLVVFPVIKLTWKLSQESEIGVSDDENMQHMLQNVTRVRGSCKRPETRISSFHIQTLASTRHCACF